VNAKRFVSCRPMKRILLLSAVILFTACHYKRKADKIFYNGNVYIVDNAFSTAQAFAIQNGRIKETGDNEDILDMFDAPEKIDLKGATVLPGFIDAHCHFYGYSTDLLKCDLYGTNSFAEVLDRLQKYAVDSRFEWILGRGWDQNDWEVKEFPTKEKLDSLFPNKPVYLMRVDGHAALCNQKALDMANINATTKVTGGEIVLKDSRLTGLLIDNAVDLVKAKIPPFTKDLIAEALLKGQKNCLEVGLTTLDDAGLGKDSIFAMLDLQKTNNLKLRIYAMISDDPKTLEYFFKHGVYKDDRMDVRAIKMYADGALGSRGACLKQPYSDEPGHYGFMLHDKKYFDHIADQAMDNGFQLCTHVIGDSAAKIILEVYNNHLTSENHRRWRLEHCQVMTQKERRLMGDNMVIPSVQPTHATSDMYWAEDRLGKDRMQYAYAYEDLRDACDGMIAFGTDFPVENINPIYTYYAAVERKDLNGDPKKGFQTENKIKPKDAIRAMTIWAAFANFEDEEKGSIEEGKFADFVILNRDLYKSEGKDILKTKVMETWIGGERVY
jgi:predicted amidohydrolase YtcJ